MTVLMVVMVMVIIIVMIETGPVRLDCVLCFLKTLEIVIRYPLWSAVLDVQGFLRLKILPMVGLKTVQVSQ